MFIVSINIFVYILVLYSTKYGIQYESAKEMPPTLIVGNIIPTYSVLSALSKPKQITTNIRNRVFIMH